jgi:hypothetical protein
MSRMDFESRALRRRLLVGLGAFVLAFPALLGVAIYLLLLLREPADGWFSVVMTVLNLLPIIVAGAAGLAWAAIYLVELPFLLRGDYRCHSCGRPQRGLGAMCPCIAATIPRRRARHWVHYRRRIKPVLMTYAALVGIVLLFMAWQSRPRQYPFVLDVMIGHAALAALLGVLIHLAIALLEIVGRGHRFRLRAIVYGRVLVAWPFCFFVVMAILTGLGVT